MARVLSINSQNWVAQQGTYGTYVFKLPKPQSFDGWKVGLKSLSIPNSFKNITAATFNNQLTVVFPATFNKNPLTGATITPVSSWTFNLTIPDGFYQISSLNYQIQDYFSKLGMIAANSAGQLFPFVEIVANAVTYGADINLYPVTSNGGLYTLPSNAPYTWGSGLCPTVTISQPNLSALLGIAVGSYGGGSSAITASSTFSPQINRVNAIVLGLNLINDTFNLPTSIFYQTGITTSFGFPIVASEGDPLYVDIAKGSYQTVEITIYDQNFNPLPVYDYAATFSIALLPPGA